MNEELWTAVDRFISDLLIAPDSALDEAVRASTEAGLPAIQVSAPLGKFLHLLAKICGAHTILEIGTLGGYSTIWLARALPTGGRLITLEADPKHAEVARANIARAGLDEGRREALGEVGEDRRQILQRHAGTQIQVRPWQRRWPILGALILLPRLFLRGAIR